MQWRKCPKGIVQVTKVLKTNNLCVLKANTALNVNIQGLSSIKSKNKKAKCPKGY